MPTHRAPRRPALLGSLNLLAALPVACVLAAGTAAAAPELSKAKVTVNGKPLQLKGAAIFGLGTSSLTLELSSAPLPCSHYADGDRPVAEGERFLAIEFKARLQPDGSTRWVTTRLEMDQHSPSPGEDLSRLELLDHDASKPVRFKLGQPVVLPASEMRDLPEAKLSLDGAGTADGCGLRKRTFDDEKARPQANLKLTAAGRAFAVQGATYSESGDKLVLSTSPLSCDGGNSSDLLIEIPVKASYEGTHQIFAKGDVLASQYNRVAKHLATAETAAEPGGEALFVALLPAKAKGEALTVKLAGTFMLGDVPVVLAGEVSAVDCDNQR